MQHVRYLSFLISIFYLASCDSDTKQSTTLFVSSVKHLSTQEPFYEVLVQGETTLYKYDYWENSESLSNNNFENIKPGDEIKYDENKTFTKVYNFTSYDNLHIYKDSTNFYTFLKTEQSKPIDKNKFLDYVQNKFFQTKISNIKTPNSAMNILESIQFSKDSLTYCWDYFYNDKLLYKETETVNFNFFEVDDQLFIIPSNIENPYPMYQVFDWNGRNLELRNFIEFETRSNIYTLAKDDTFSDYHNYSLCKNDFQKIYYVGENVRYSHGLEHLLNTLQDNAPKAENDGYINIHFTINCKGEVGRLGLELLDTEYKPANFNPELIKHIVDKVVKIKSWDNYLDDPYYGSKDIKSFFLIKIQNQKIVDVCP
jgi:hypothetical protein